MTWPAALILAIAAVYFLVVSMTLTFSPRLQAQTFNISVDNSHSIPNLSVFSSDSKPYNFTYGEWTARWWQWGYSIPKNINPAYDNTGKDCAQGQSGPVWFLAGTYGHPVERVCTVLVGKAILFPILIMDNQAINLYTARHCVK
jgi:hypothetical protein